MEALKSVIRDIPDFPKEGIVFKDITPLLSNPILFKTAIDTLKNRYLDLNIDQVVGVEARGFIFASALAYALGSGIVMARKPGKLPYKTYQKKYNLEYGEDCIEIMDTDNDGIGDTCDNDSGCENGLSTLLVSVYDSKEDAIRLEKLLLNCNLNENQFKIRHRYLPPEKDFGITLSNRSGMMENAEFKIKTLDEPLKVNCYYPFYTFFIDYTGEVLICSHDWGKKLVVGNIKENKILDIWMGHKFTKARELLGKANRRFSPCNKCDVQGVLMGKNHYSAWNNIDN